MRDERGLATLETTFAITILVPLLFSILEFGSALERWLAQDAATVQAARYAGELGGDAPELRVGGSPRGERSPGRDCIRRLR